MSYQNESFGMMDEGYFVPRGEITTWLNDLLKLNITKIQQLGSGAVYCQVIDVIHPGKVALSKVNWKARNDYQFIGNLKLLQNAFDKIGIKRHVEVEKLAKAKYQDNLEFIQWLKRYYDINCGERGGNYQAQQRRGNVPVDLSFADKTVIPKTYNASGVAKQTIKNQKPPAQKVQKVQKVQKKKPITTNAPPKAEQGTNKVKSPRNQINKGDTVKKVQPKPKTATGGSRTEIKSAKEVKQKSQPKIQESEHQQKQESDHQLQAQLQAAFAELQQSKNQCQAYQQKVKELEHESAERQEKLKHAQMKLEMIKELLKSEDDSGMKITLIQEIFKQ